MEIDEDDADWKSQKLLTETTTENTTFCFVNKSIRFEIFFELQDICLY